MASLGEGALKTDVPATMTLQPASVGCEKRGDVVDVNDNRRDRGERKKDNW
jgi:hypothetical protein